MIEAKLPGVQRDRAESLVLELLTKELRRPIL